MRTTYHAWLEEQAAYEYDEISFGMYVGFGRLLLYWRSYAVFFHIMMLVVLHLSWWCLKDPKGVVKRCLCVSQVMMVGTGGRTKSYELFQEHVVLLKGSRFLWTSSMCTLTPESW